MASSIWLKSDDAGDSAPKIWVDDKGDPQSVDPGKRHSAWAYDNFLSKYRDKTVERTPTVNPDKPNAETIEYKSPEGDGKNVEQNAAKALADAEGVTNENDAYNLLLERGWLAVNRIGETLSVLAGGYENLLAQEPWIKKEMSLPNYSLMLVEYPGTPAVSVEKSDFGEGMKSSLQDALTRAQSRVSVSHNKSVDLQGAGSWITAGKKLRYFRKGSKPQKPLENLQDSGGEARARGE
jgi:hypothetical protein